MTCSEADDLVVDYLYDELDEAGRRSFAAHLQGCEACRQKVAGSGLALARTRQVIAESNESPPARVRAGIASLTTLAARGPQRVPTIGAPVIPEDAGGIWRILRKPWFFPAFAAAGVIGLFFMAREAILEPKSLREAGGAEPPGATAEATSSTEERATPPTTGTGDRETLVGGAEADRAAAAAKGSAPAVAEKHFRQTALTDEAPAVTSAESASGARPAESPAVAPAKAAPAAGTDEAPAVGREGYAVAPSAASSGQPASDLGLGGLTGGGAGPATGSAGRDGLSGLGAGSQAVLRKRREQAKTTVAQPVSNDSRSRAVYPPPSRAESARSAREPMVAMPNSAPPEAEPARAREMARPNQGGPVAGVGRAATAPGNVELVRRPSPQAVGLAETGGALGAMPTGASAASSTAPASAPPPPAAPAAADTIGTPRRSTPPSRESLVELGANLLRQGRLPEAAAVYRSLIARFPKDAEVKSWKAQLEKTEAPVAR